MARSGIYANGKEIVARYVGDKLVWQKQIEIVDINRTEYIRTGYFNNTIYISGNFTYLQQATFYDVTLIIDGVTFPHLLKEVKLSPSNPIATVQFYNYKEYDDFVSNVRLYQSHTIKMFK